MAGLYWGRSLLETTILTVISQGYTSPSPSIFYVKGFAEI